MLSRKWNEERPDYFVLRHGALDAVIRKDIDGWVLEAEDAPFRWREKDFSDLDTQALSIEAYLAEVAEFRSRPERKQNRKLPDGMILEYGSNPQGFHVSLLDSSRLEVGYYAGFLNQAASRFVLQQMTISGNMWLADDYRGKGYADVMRDAAEEITGFPSVPHGRNMVEGSITTAGMKSWNKRSASKPYPGFKSDMMTAIRLNQALINQKYWADRMSSENIDRFIALSATTGCDIVLAFNPRDEDYSHVPAFAYVVAPDGTPISADGYADELELIEVQQRRNGFPATFERLSGDAAYAKYFSGNACVSGGTPTKLARSEFFERMEAKLRFQVDAMMECSRVLPADNKSVPSSTY